MTYFNKHVQCLEDEIHVDQSGYAEFTQEFHLTHTTLIVSKIGHIKTRTYEFQKTVNDTTSDEIKFMRSQSSQNGTDVLDGSELSFRDRQEGCRD